MTLSSILFIAKSRLATWRNSCPIQFHIIVNPYLNSWRHQEWHLYWADLLAEPQFLCLLPSQCQHCWIHWRDALFWLEYFGFHLDTALATTELVSIVINWMAKVLKLLNPLRYLWFKIGLHLGKIHIQYVILAFMEWLKQIFKHVLCCPKWIIQSC